MNFNDFQAIESSNTRKVPAGLVRKQEYNNIKYLVVARKDENENIIEEGKFFISNHYYKTLDLQNNGFRQFTNPTTGETVIGLVANEHAVLMRPSKRSKENKKATVLRSTKLESALEKLGFIDSKVKDKQFLDLVKIEGSEGATVAGIPCIAVYTVAKGAVVAKTAKKAKEVKEEKVEKTKVEASSVDENPSTSADSASAPTPADKGWE